MIIFITGTPGTGKTTISQLLIEQLSIKLVDVNKLVEDEKIYTGYDEEWGYKIVDIPSLCRALADVIDRSIEDLLIEGHLSHFCHGADLVVVLRTNPKVLENRLHSKGFKDSKVRENIMAEALDICAFEAFQKYGDKVHEIDTTYKKPQEIVDIIKKILKGEKSYPAGEIDFSDYLYQQIK